MLSAGLVTISQLLPFAVRMMCVRSLPFSMRAGGGVRTFLGCSKFFWAYKIFCSNFGEYAKIFYNFFGGEVYKNVLKIRWGEGIRK